MTVLQLLICILWCQRLLRQNECCCYKLILRVEKKKSKHFCSILREAAVLRFMPGRSAFWKSCAFSIGILEHYLEMVFWICVLCFSHMSAISVCSLPYHQHCTLGETTRRIKDVIMRVIFYYLNSKWVIFCPCKCLISLKRVHQNGKNLGIFVLGNNVYG